MRRHLRLTRNSNQSVNKSITDQDEQFAIRHCALYLHRHLSKYSIYDDECFRILCQVLGQDMTGLGDFLLSQLHRSKDDEEERRRFTKQLEEAQFDTYDYATVVAKMFHGVKKSNIPQIRRFVLDTLKDIHKNLVAKEKSDIEKSLIMLQTMFNLTTKEYEVCAFLFILSLYDYAEKFWADHLKCNHFTGRKYLMNTLGLSKREFSDIFSGTIRKIGLLEMDLYNLGVESDFFEMILSPSGQIISSYYSPLKKTTTPLEQHFVGTDETRHLINLLKTKTTSATHILLYGAPGTGKSSYAQGIAEEISAPAYQITQGGEGNQTDKRRAAITACMNLTNNGEGSLIVIDEADNLLNTQFSWLMRGETQDKGWLNNLMEEPGTRIIWITNDLDSVEDSVLRRFAFSLHFKPFNRRQRISMWGNLLKKNRLKRYFDTAAVESFASRYHMSAGAIDMALTKVKESGGRSKKEIAQAVNLSLKAHETLQNKGVSKHRQDNIERDYSLDGLSIDGDLSAMVRQLEHFDRYLRHPDDSISRFNMNLLFYGPPGTGKSELARYLAHRLDREVIAKRLSDILDPYVGMTERRISEAFAEAEAEEAVLVIDEVDSLLFSRSNAKRSWETSQTNEFLTQMERFKGILICTTNLFGSLDEASLRRFNHKVGFKFLEADGNTIFYQKLLSGLVAAPLDKFNENKIRGINDLAPGDFKVVRDRYGFYQPDELSHEQLINDLQQEAQLKQTRDRKIIGFAA